MIFSSDTKDGLREMRKEGEVGEGDQPGPLEGRKLQQHNTWGSWWEQEGDF